MTLRQPSPCANRHGRAHWVKRGTTIHEFAGRNWIQKRRAKREEYTTPAMRMYLATLPVALETMLNTDWYAKLATSPRQGSVQEGEPSTPASSRA